MSTIDTTNNCKKVLFLRANKCDVNVSRRSRYNECLVHRASQIKTNDLPGLNAGGFNFNLVTDSP